ncbi:hypothetical protein FRC12_006931, partial [Ceratobasidium sp. 428]
MTETSTAGMPWSEARCGRGTVCGTISAGGVCAGLRPDCHGIYEHSPVRLRVLSYSCALRRRRLRSRDDIRQRQEVCLRDMYQRPPVVVVPAHRAGAVRDKEKRAAGDPMRSLQGATQDEASARSLLLRLETGPDARSTEGTWREEGCARSLLTLRRSSRKPGSRLPAEAAYPHGLSPGVTGVATSPAPAKHAAETCACGEGETCHCCVPRKAAPKTHGPPTHPSGHTPPPVHASGHSPNNPHQHPHQHHLHAYAPYTRPAVRLSTDSHGAQLAANSNPNLGLSAANFVPSPGAMYRVGPCACGTTCACPDCAHHRQQPHSHQPQQGQPVQGHGGDPCPIRCTNCFDCAGGLTLLLDPTAYQSPPYTAESDVASFSAFSGSDPNASVQSFESEAQAGAYGGSGQFFSPAMVDASGMDVDMDNAEFTAAMAGLDAGIGASEANANTTPDASSFWDRPRCGFAVSTERGNGSPGHARIGSEVGSEIGVGSDGGFDLGSELGIGSDDGGSVAGVGSTNLSMDFADLDFGGLQLPPMQQQYPYPDHASQRFSGEYTFGDRHSMHGGRVASTSSQFSNHSNLSLVSSIDSASVSLASLGSSHGIASLASSHHIPPSGRVTPGHSGRITPVRGVTPHSPQGGKPLPRGYRRILPKVAAMTNHRPFRRHHHSAQPSLHAVMESDAAGGNVTSPPPSQVLLQPQPVQVQQPRVRKSVRSHLPIVGKYFAPGGR